MPAVFAVTQLSSQNMEDMGMKMMPTIPLPKKKEREGKERCLLFFLRMKDA
uniref:Uncharacterized protein n=1 Tax=Arundo donax TaxID=35708 RepID=A0A0A9AV08_ARUDO